MLSVNIQKFFFFKFNSLLPANDILKNLIELHVGKENILKEHAMDMPYVAYGIMYTVNPCSWATCLWNNVYHKSMQLCYLLVGHFIRTKMLISMFRAPLQIDPQLP